MPATRSFRFPGHYPFCKLQAIDSSTIDTLEDSMLLWWLLKSATFTAEISTVQPCPGRGTTFYTSHTGNISMNWDVEPIDRICYDSYESAWGDQTGEMIMNPAIIGENRGALNWYGDQLFPPGEVDQCSLGNYYLSFLFSVSIVIDDTYSASGISTTSFTVEIKPGRTVDLIAAVQWDESLLPGYTVSIDSVSGSVELWEPG